MFKSPGHAAGGFGSGLGFRPINVVATDSENSEDRSSRSSTMAGAPGGSQRSAPGGMDILVTVLKGRVELLPHFCEI